METKVRQAYMMEEVSEQNIEESAASDTEQSLGLNLCSIPKWNMS